LPWLVDHSVDLATTDGEALPIFLLTSFREVRQRTTVPCIVAVSYLFVAASTIQTSAIIVLLSPFADTLLGFGALILVTDALLSNRCTADSALLAFRGIRRYVIVTYRLATRYQGEDGEEKE
jgi:hypothetical protein